MSQRHELTLDEFKKMPAVPLTSAQRDALQTRVPRLSVTPSPGTDSAYDLTPGSVVGAVELEDLSVQIRPKITIDRLLFLISYAFDPAHWKETSFDFDPSRGLVEAVIPGFVFQARRALREGVLPGYQRKREALAGVKGRIRFDDQLRSRFGIAPPVEVTYDEFTEDILPNRLLKAAAVRLCRLRIRDQSQRRDLSKLLRDLERVSLDEFPPGSPPAVTYSRLNEHYRPAVELARFIIKSTAYELGHGNVAGRSFLVDMNAVFEDFVVVALREALGLSGREFPQNAEDRDLFLDSDHDVRLKPDLSWWDAGRPVFVGDVKYKKLDVRGFKHADLYQLLAYTISTGLPDGLLIYAAGESEPGMRLVPLVGKRLHITTLSVGGPPGKILDEVASVAEMVVDLQRRVAAA